MGAQDTEGGMLKPAFHLLFKNLLREGVWRGWSGKGQIQVAHFHPGRK